MPHAGATEDGVRTTCDVGGGPGMSTRAVASPTAGGRHATSVCQGNGFSAAIGPVSKATQ